MECYSVDVIQMTGTYNDISLMSDILVSPWVMSKLSPYWRTFVGLVNLIDDIRCGSILMYGATTNGRLAGLIWTSQKDETTIVGHAAVVPKFTGTVPFAKEVIRMIKLTWPNISQLMAFIPADNRAAQLFARRLKMSADSTETIPGCVTFRKEV